MAPKNPLFSGRPGARTLETTRGFRRDSGRGRETGVLRLKGTIRSDIAASLSIVARAAGLVGRDELMLAAANQVCAAHTTQGFPKHRPVIRVVITQKCLVK